MAIQQIDDAILQLIQQFCRTPFGDKAAVAVSLLGNAGLIWIVCAAVLLILPKQRKSGAVMALALLFCLLIGNCGLKLLVARPRPCDVDPSVLLLIPRPGEFSFPSGHSMSSFAAATALFFYHKKWGIGALALAGLIALSRLYLYVHYPTDVLAGALIGVGLAFLSRYLVKRLVACFAARKEGL